MRLVLLGAPGSGKGTQAKRIQEKFDLVPLSTGDLLRAALNAEVPESAEIKQSIQTGQLVPDSIVINLLQRKIRELNCKQGFILDGFPRNVFQAESLEQVMTKIGQKLDLVLCFEIETSALIDRLTGRRICPHGHGEWHIHFQPPSQPGKCDVCADDLVQRIDDQEVAIATRLQVYQEQALPLLQFYDHKQLMKRVDASLSSNEVTDKVYHILNRLLE